MKTILVCGCSSGIGEHLFKHYNLNSFYETYGISRTIGVVCNATDSASVRETMLKIKPDILLNCVGQAKMNLALLSTEDAFEKTVVNNMKSTFLLNREAGKQMKLKGWGRIINFGSCAVSMDMAGESLYAASKAASNQFSRILAKELAPSISVNTISCGPVDTRLIRSVEREKIDAVVNRQIIRRMTTFEEIANLCDFLISDNAGMITGQNIYINGAG